jgi:hypothetical protein
MDLPSLKDIDSFVNDLIETNSAEADGVDANILKDIFRVLCSLPEATQKTYVTQKRYWIKKHLGDMFAGDVLDRHIRFLFVSDQFGLRRVDVGGGVTVDLFNKSVCFSDSVELPITDLDWATVLGHTENGVGFHPNYGKQLLQKSHLLYNMGKEKRGFFELFLYCISKHSSRVNAMKNAIGADLYYTLPALITDYLNGASREPLAKYTMLIEELAHARYFTPHQAMAIVETFEEIYLFEHRSYE